MAYPIRCFEPNVVYSITCRCARRQLLLRPSDEVTAIVGGVLARALAKYDVELFAVAFMSNHFHMLLRSREPRLISKFVGFVNGAIATRINRLLDLEGRLWHRRFHAAPVLDDGALDDRLRYIFMQGVKEGLVDHARLWPGLTSVPELADGASRWFEWSLASGRERASYALRVSPPPPWSSWSPEARRAKVGELIDAAMETARKERGDKPALGVEAVLAQSPLAFPQKSVTKPAPLCHASDPAVRSAYLLRRREIIRAYRVASERFRRGIGSLDEFPPHCFPPAPRFIDTAPALAA
jgi:putative transposase